MYFAKLLSIYNRCTWLPFTLQKLLPCIIFAQLLFIYHRSTWLPLHFVIYLPSFHRVTLAQLLSIYQCSTELSLQNCYHVLCSIVIYLPSMHMVTCTTVTQLLPYTIVTYLKGYFKEYYFNDDLRLF